MAEHLCAACGKWFKAVERKAKAVAPAVDTATMTEADLYAWYRKTAPVEDARFYLRVLNGTLAPALRGALDSLILQAPARAEFYRQLWAVKAQWARARLEPSAGAGSGFGVWVRDGMECSGYDMAGADRPTPAQEQHQEVGPCENS